MEEPTEPLGRRPQAASLQLTSGINVLDEWSERASQIEKNIVHQVLFAVVGRSVFDRYDVIDDVEKTMEFFVLAPCELTVKIRVHGLGSFGIMYVGPTCDAPGLDRIAPEAAASGPEPGFGR